MIRDEAKIVEDGDYYAPVGHYLINKYHLEKKDEFKTFKSDPDIGEIWINKSKNEKIENENGNYKLEFNENYIIGNTSDSPHLLFQKIIESTKKKFIHNVITIKSLKDYGIINSIYIQYFKEIDPPSRVFIENDEIEFLQIECYISDHELKVLHVQSISEWAPASIGPYSQAVFVDDIIRVAGQIGLVPSIMKLSKNENQQCLQNIENILRAMNTSSENIFKVNIYYDVNKMKYDEISLTINTKYKPILNIIGCSSLPRGSKIEYQIFASNNIEECNEHHAKIGNYEFFKFDTLEELLKQKMKFLRIIGEYNKIMNIKEKILKDHPKLLISLLPSKFCNVIFELENEN